ncbi:MAG: DUF134 domain-containing protein [Chlorobiaceae bacterium]|nr:DUF134 domain-containing protein [Chlorobiaceae bacterium]
MPRPVKCRKIGGNPEYRMFKPAGIPARDLDEVIMTFDELEAIRLVDSEGLYQEDAANQMQVSRQTFSNILSSARHKVAEMLINGRRLTITGGNIMVSSEERVFGCSTCRHQWSVPHGTSRPEICPSCESENLHRIASDGSVGGGRHGGGKCRGLRTGSGRQGRGSGSRHGQQKPDDHTPRNQNISETNNGEHQ